MQCQSCGTRLSEGAAYCRACATPTPYGLSQSQSTPDDPTFVSSPSSPPPPPIVSATPPYEVPSQNPYERNPYAASYQSYAPPLTNPDRRPSKAILIVAVAAALVIIVGGMAGLPIITGANHGISKPTPVSSPSLLTATAPTTQYPFSTHVLLDDPLSNTSHAATYGWGIATTSNGGCAFANGAYEITANRDYLYCPAHHATFSNFTYEIQMTIKSGGAGAMGGVIFRHELGTGKNYMFFLGTDGSYELSVNMDYSSGSTLSSGTIAGIALGFNHLHTIGIVANRQELSVYVDQQYVTQVADSTYASGAIGMLSRYGTSSTTVAYTNAKVWQL